MAIRDQKPRSTTAQNTTNASVASATHWSCGQ